MNTTPCSLPRITSTASHPDSEDAGLDATKRIPAAGTRALVLGGGGSSGNAWNIGVVAGLFAAGLDVTCADLIVGTSAGATAAAQLTGASPSDLLAAILAAGDPAPSGPARRGAPVTKHLDRLSALIAASEDVVDLRRRLGAAALELEASSDGSWQSRWRDTVAARLPTPHWPEQALLITAVDALSAQPVVFDRQSGVELVDAVAASCSNGFGVPPYRIGDRRYLDGGYRSNAENADLATGYDRVLVLSPFGGRSLHPQHWGTHLATQVDELRARGSSVETIFPAAGSEHLFGANAMNLAQRPAAARAGFDHGGALADQLIEFWR